MLEKRSNDKYLSVLGDGTLRLPANQNEDGAVLREFETSDGKTGSKWEFVYNSIQGQITGLAFFEGDYGKQLQVRIKDGEEEVVLSLNTQTPFGEDFMKKLPNIDLNEKVKISPYAITNENGKVNKGVSIFQGDKKIANFFYDPVAKKQLNGFPKPEGDTDSYDKEDWKIYFLQARKFLIKYTEDNFVSKFVPKADAKMEEYPEYTGQPDFGDVEEDALSKFKEM